MTGRSSDGESVCSASTSPSPVPPEAGAGGGGRPNSKMYGRVWTDDELDAYVEREFGVDKQMAERMFNEIRGWADDNLPVDADDDFVHMFLRGCKFNMDKAKKKLATYFKYRVTHEFYWKNMSYENKEIKKLLDTGAFLPLPAYDELGRRVILERVCQLVPVDMIDDHCKLVTWIFFNTLYHDKQAQILGLTFINDARGASWGHLYGYLGHVKNAVMILKDGFPGRLSVIHLMKPPMIVKPIVFVFSTFTADKFGKMMYHSEWKDLQTHISRDALPVRIGGTEFTEQEANKIFIESCNPHLPATYGTTT